MSTSSMNVAQTSVTFGQIWGNIIAMFARMMSKDHRHLDHVGTALYHHPMSTWLSCLSV